MVPETPPEKRIVPQAPHAARKPVDSVTDRLVRTISRRLRDNRRVRRTLPPWGRVHIDRQLPFLCVYRRTPAWRRLNMQHFVTSEASYLFADGAPRLHAGLAALVDEIAAIMLEQFGAFLLVEVWPSFFEDTSRDSARSENELPVAAPRFRILTHRQDELGGFIDRFVEFLSRIKIAGRSARVDVAPTTRTSPRGLKPLLSATSTQDHRCWTLGLEMLPVHADIRSRELFPKVRRQMERALAVALKRTFFEFTRSRTTHRPPHYHALGRRATVRAVWIADRMLSEVSECFDFLLQVSPINGQAAWKEFQRGKYRQQPTFHYRPLPIDPVALKRRLYATPVDRVEDPAIGQLLRDKVTELDRQIGMLADIGTRRFVHGSIQLYGGVEQSLLARAEKILTRLPKASRLTHADELDAHAFARRAEDEVGYLRSQDENVAARVEVRADINGLIVSRGSLLVGADTRVAPARVEALLQHEIGTHVLTYYNGRAQPFRQLSAGLSGYEELQEGLAVLAEHLVGGLDKNRLRLLASRVVAVNAMVAGHSFLECFERLVEEYGFTTRAAFLTTMRAFRGGGLTKDAIYLRGLVQLLEHLRKGGEIEQLLVGKISTQHIGVVRELRWRKVLAEPKLVPRYLSSPEARSRLERARRGLEPLDLLETRKPLRGRRNVEPRDTAGKEPS